MSALVLVVAMDRTHAIGRDGAMPWHLPADLKRFKTITMGHPMLMGRRTAEAIGRSLPGRENLVLTRSDAAPYPGQQVVASVDAAIERAGARDLMVIGGGEVYALTLPRATRIHLTLIDARTQGADTFFPAFDRTAWRQTLCVHHPADSRHAHAFDFIDLERRR